MILLLDFFVFPLNEEVNIKNVNSVHALLLQFSKFWLIHKLNKGGEIFFKNFLYSYTDDCERAISRWSNDSFHVCSILLPIVGRITGVQQTCDGWHWSNLDHSWSSKFGFGCTVLLWATGEKLIIRVIENGQQPWLLCAWLTSCDKTLWPVRYCSSDNCPRHEA